MKKVLALLMALVLVLSLAACGGSSETSMTKEELLEIAHPTSIKNISEEADSNIARASSTYVDNTYTVWGCVTEIASDTITLSGYGSCYLRAEMTSDEIMNLNTGDRIQIVGTISEITEGTISMKNAHFVTDEYKIENAIGIDITYSRITYTYICKVVDDNFGQVTFSTNKITNAQWNKYDGYDFKVSASGKFIKAPNGYENDGPFMDDSNFTISDK